MDQHSIAWCEAGLLQRVVRGHKHFRHGRGKRPVEIVGYRSHHPLMHDHVFGIGAAAGDPEHALAGL